MPQVIVHYRDNWGDEFDIYGCQIMEHSEWTRIVENIKFDKYFEFQFGTNESICYESEAEFLKHFWHIPLREEEVKNVKRAFKNISTGYGHWPFKNLNLSEIGL